MLYEEAVGFKNARRIMYAGFAVLGFNISMMMSMWFAYGGTSRHIDLTPEQNAQTSQFIEDRFGTIFDLFSGDGPRNMPQKSYIGRGPA